MSYLDDKSTTVALNGGAIVIDGTPTSLPDFFRSANGANVPDGASDYTKAITHNGFVGISQTADPRSPLQFGNLIRNDVIRLWDNTATPNEHQFYGFGVNAATLRYQVVSLIDSHTFFGGASSTASRQFASVQNRKAIFGEPLAPLGEGHFELGTLGGDDGRLSFRSPNASVGGALVQSEIYFNGWSGGSGRSGASIVLQTRDNALDPLTAPLLPRLAVSTSGHVAIANPGATGNTISTDVATGNTALSVSGAIRLKGGPIVSGDGPQSGGIVFGMDDSQVNGVPPRRPLIGDTDSGITSTGDGNLTLYTNGVANFIFNGQAAIKQGGGLWSAPSDVRVKRDVSAHQPNPVATLALEPIEYFYNGEGGSIDDGKRHVGFSAQALQTSDFAHWVSVGTKAIDGDPVRQVDLSNLTFELLGVVKMQAKQIEALEQRLLALEPKPPTAAQVAKRK